MLQMAGVLFLGLTIPCSAIIADRIGERAMLVVATVLIIAFGFAFRPLFSAHRTAGVLLFLSLGFALTGLTYGPLGSALAKLFPTAVRYTGTSLTYNLAGILGASLAPSIAVLLASRYGVGVVGYYLSAAGIVTLIALLLIKLER
jgi:MFS family permease